MVQLILSRWQALISDLQEAQPISIPRSYFNRVNGEVRSYQLYGFCDASIRAYAAVVYLAIETDVGNYVKFVVSKTRVAPIQSQTIPRLELLSAQLVSNTIVSLSSQLKLTQPRCFTDSRVALFWIRGLNREWKPSV